MARKQPAPAPILGDNKSLSVEWWAIARVKPYERNARKIPQSAIDKVATSIREFGWRQPIVVDEHGVILAGHARLLAARQLQATEVPVHQALGLTPAQCKAYRLMDNRSHDEAQWDLDLIGPELLELRAMDFDLNLTGFDMSQVKTHLRGGGLTDPDDVPEVQPVVVTQPGDLWLLGDHRLLCGDSTELAAVERVMDGQKADLVFTDPPYNVVVCGGTHDPRDQRNYGKGPKIQNDAMPDREFMQFLRDALLSCAAMTKAGAAIYVCHADTKGRLFREAFEDAGFFLHAVVIWVKQQFVFGRSDYHWQHEPILYGWMTGAAHQFYGERNQGTTWNIDRPMRSDMAHPTQKPVALAEKAIVNSSKAGNIILDQFGGGGSTLVACEKSGRSARLLEIDPQYVDVIVRRWQAFTGREATLEGHGSTFERVAEGRALEREDHDKDDALRLIQERDANPA
jgi:DNA modification methylase